MRDINKLSERGMDMMTPQRDLKASELNFIYNQFNATANEKGSVEALLETISKCFYLGVYEGAKMTGK